DAGPVRIVRGLSARRGVVPPPSVRHADPLCRRQRGAHRCFRGHSRRPPASPRAKRPLLLITRVARPDPHDAMPLPMPYWRVTYRTGETRGGTVKLVAPAGFEPPSRS